MSRFTKGLFAVAGMSLCVSGTALANDLTVVSWGGAYTKSQVEAYHKPWMAKTGKTIIVITHSVEEALLLGERLFVMAPRPGRIHREYNLPFAEMGLTRSLREIKQEQEFSSIREEILTMIWDMEEEIMGHG